MTGPHWMPIALAELGQVERVGDPDNPRIVEYHAATTLKATDDETPWCSAFACWVMRAAGLSTKRSALARSWLEWGVETPERYGAIAVFARGTSPTQGHVAFLIDTSPAAVWVLGGNQGNAVSLARYERARLLGLRWPEAT